MPRTMLSPLPQSQRGSVLIVVLCASIGLVSVALLFGHSMLMNYRGTDDEIAGRQADAAIEGGIRYVESLLVDAETPGAFPDPTTYEAEALAVGEATFWLIGRPDDAGNGTTREYGLVDEAAKLNLNTADPKALAYLPGMTDDLADMIKDWRSTSGSNASSGGITATVVKHDRFESPQELALLGGFTRDILYGEDANLNGVLDANEDDGDRTPPADGSDGKLDPGVLEYVTTFTKEPDKDQSGNDRLDVSQAALRNALRTLINNDPTIGAARAAQINQALDGPGGSTSPQPLGSVLEMFIRGGFSAEEADAIADQVRGPAVDNLVNVNTASETVLACLMGEDEAQQVISARLTNLPQGRDMTWLNGVIQPATVASVGRFLTGSTYQISADIAAVGRHGRGFRRTRVVIDMSTGTPRVIYRQNLAPLGWALGSDVRQNLALKKEVR